MNDCSDPLRASEVCESRSQTLELALAPIPSGFKKGGKEHTTPKLHVAGLLDTEIPTGPK